MPRAAAVAVPKSRSVSRSPAAAATGRRASASTSAARVASIPRKPTKAAATKAAAAATAKLAAAPITKLVAAEKKIAAAAVEVEEEEEITDKTFAETQTGSGAIDSKIEQPQRDVSNHDDCFHCPQANCHCVAFAAAFAEAQQAVGGKRITEVAGNKGANAKSLLPNFTARMAGLLTVTAGADVFYDLGCGNGSILFQMAMVTGAECVGVELCKHNSELARQIWAVLEPKLEAIAGRKMPKVTVITGDLTDFIMRADFDAPKRLPKILTSNLVMPKPVTHFMSERFRTLPLNAQVLCFDDLYPHQRSVAMCRDPEAFELFAMKDYMWPCEAVEWMYGTGEFFIHTRK